MPAPSNTPETATLPLAFATAAANWVIHALGLTQDEVLIGGSIRRQAAQVKDIELIVAGPGEGQPDKLLGVIRDRLVVPGWHSVEQVELVEEEIPSLVGAPEIRTTRRAFTPPVPAEPIGVAVKGAKPGFKYCQLRVQSPKDPKVFVSVDLFRYVPGPQGNRGWIELIRTGPWQFGRAACARWKQLNPGACSDEGFLRRSDGTPVPCLTEQDAFALLEWKWIEPQHRTG